MNQTRIVVGSSLALVAFVASAEPVGRVILKSGAAFAVREGREIPLTFGSPIEAKDLLRTGPKSSLQVSFSDDGIKSIRENSELVVEEFRFAGSEDGSEKAVFRLLKGGFRAVTGLIGRTNHKNYSVRTPTATVGIRGTDYVVRDCRGDCGAGVKDGTYGSVLGLSHGTNEVTLNNDAGDFSFGISQHFYVADMKSAPEPLLQPPSFVSAKPEGQAQATQQGGAGTGLEATAPSTGVVAESRPSLIFGTETPQVFYNQYPSPENAAGAASPITTTAAPVTSPTVAPATTDVSEVLPPAGGGGFGGGDGSPGPVGTNLSLMSAEYNTSTQAHNATNTGTGFQTTYDAGGTALLTATTDGTSGYLRNDAIASESGTFGSELSWSRWNSGTPTLFGWGLQTLAADQGFHLVVGVPATSLPSQDGVTFSLIGATRPTETRSGALGGWSVTGGSFTANFLAGNLSGTLGLDLSRTAENGTFAMNFSGVPGLGFNSISATVTRTAGTAAICATSCSGNGNLMFAGAMATSAGMTYEFNAGSYYVQGAAAFKR